jgi:hypothetical protein
MKPLLMLFVLVLAGCQSDQEAMSKQREVTSKTQDGQCRSFGAKPGTSDYIRCRENLYAANAQRRQMAAAILLSRPVAVPQQAYVMQTRNPVNCRSTGMGTAINTTCY